MAKRGWLGFDSRHKQKLFTFDNTSSLASYSTGAGISPGYFDSSVTTASSPASRTKLKNASNFTSTPPSHLSSYTWWQLLWCDDCVKIKLSNHRKLKYSKESSKLFKEFPFPLQLGTTVTESSLWKGSSWGGKEKKKNKRKTTASVLALFTPVYLRETMTYSMSTNSVLYNVHRIILDTAALGCHLCNTQISRYNYTLFPKFVLVRVISGYTAPNQYTLSKHFLGGKSGIISM